MKRTLLFASAILLLLAPFSTVAQVGNPFPTISGETAEDKAVTLPTDTKGKYSLVGIAWSEDAEHHLRSWYDPVYTMFIDKSGMYDLIYDVNVQMVLAFAGINQVALEKAKKSMKENTDKDLIPYVMFYGGEFKSYKKELALKDKTKPYIFVLDPQGKIIYTTSGSYTEKKIDEIGKLVELD